MFLSLTIALLLLLLLLLPQLISSCIQVNNQAGLSEFSGLRSSAASLPFARKTSEDFLSVIAFQTSAVSLNFPLRLPYIIYVFVGQKTRTTWFEILATQV
jgi:hypothetical protein